MELSIIIVNWKSVDYLRVCLSSIYRETRDLSFEIIVVDNASGDGCEAAIRNEFPCVVFHQSVENLGFAKANNLGYTRSSGKILVFLNPDTEIHDNVFARMVRYLRANPSVAVVGARLLNSDGTLQTSCVQAFPTILNQVTDVEAIKVRFPGVRMWGIKPLFQSERQMATVQAVSGACLVIRREVFEQVGLFSIDYFMYCEDIDLCYKVAATGYQVGYVGDATVIHHGGQSSKRSGESAFADVVGREAIRTFLTKHRSGLYARGYTCSMLCVALVRLALLRLPPSLLGRDRAGMVVSRRKWRNILSWSLGREGWAKQLGNGAATPAEAARVA